MADHDKNIYCIFDDFLVFQGRYGKSSMHSHHYIQMGFSKSMAFQLHSPEWKEKRRVSSYYIPPDITHRVHLSGADRVLMIWMDPERHSSLLPNDRESIQYPIEGFEQKLEQLSEKNLNCTNARQIRELIVGVPSDKKEMDGRINESIHWIREHLTEQTITAEELAETVYLSKSRFMHLFSDQVGIPVRKYILWQRLRHALIMLSEGCNITESAHGAGFTDSPHMNRTFNAMFGITPSKIFKNSRFIQVFAC